MCLFLRLTPAHAAREVLLLSGSLTSCDPGDVRDAIAAAAAARVRVSVVGLAAAVYICEVMCKATRGTYTVGVCVIWSSFLLFAKKKK